MKKKVNHNGSRKKHKLPSLLPDQPLISHFFSKTPNLDHVSTIEENEDEVIVMHRQSKHRVVDDEEDDDDDEVELMAVDKFVDDEDVKVRIRENKRAIKDNKVYVSDEVTIMAQAKKYKYEDTAFYQLIDSFLQESVNTSVRLPKVIHNRAIELINIELPNYTKSQAKVHVWKCTQKCRGGINIKTGEKTYMHPSVQKRENARRNPKNNLENNPKNNL